jgi:hypothetical protein
MEGREKQRTDKYKQITNDWNYDASCTLTSLPVFNLESLKRLIFLYRVHFEALRTSGQIRYIYEITIYITETLGMYVGVCVCVCVYVR